MDRYLAKSNPEETIQEHTDELLKNLELLKMRYPDIDVNWDILYLACLYHDLGKMNDKFQNKIKRNKKNNTKEAEVPHGFLSTGFLDIKKLKQKLSNEELKILINSIAYHHEREFEIADKKQRQLVKDEVLRLASQVEDFEYDKIPDIEVRKLPGKTLLSGGRVTENDGEETFYQYIKVKGLLNRIDYAASAHEVVEEPNDFLEIALDNLLEKWKRKNPESSWNEMQNYMIENRDKNVVAVAQTGMGKTEAGLLWIGNSKGFFTLPIKIAINAIYDRIIDGILPDKDNSEASNIDMKVGLLHSDSLGEYIARSESKESNLELDDEELSRYYNKSRQLSLPLTITTLDQIFDFVYRYRGFELKLATLSYSKVVVDEIQMYSPDLVAYLIYGLSLINDMGGKFAILTATFPPIFEDFMKAEAIEYEKPEPFLEDDSKARHSLKVVDDLIDSNFILKQHKNNEKVLVICNTVKSAQSVYENLKEKAKSENLDLNLNLIHSYFTKEDRKDKEKEILKLGKSGSDGKGIWIGTQILEASLDIDFDVLITELSDINGLFQRMGRCYRKRTFDGKNKYNCFVFTGGNKRIRGTGYVVDKDIFEVSKKALKDIDGIITERDKLEIINEAYTKENIGESNYYKEIEGTIDYLKTIYTNEKSKADVKRMFRNINNISIIPRKVYEENIDKIKKYFETLKYDEEQKGKYSKIDRTKARTALQELQISIPYYSFNEKLNERIDINKYEQLNIYDCTYDNEAGFNNVKEDQLDEKNDKKDNFF